MRKSWLLSTLCLLIVSVVPTFTLHASQDPAVATVEITPATVNAVVGQKLKFTALAKDASGKTVNLKPSVWLAGPDDIAGVDESGAVTLYSAGEARVGAMIGGVTGYAMVIVRPAPVSSIDIAPVIAPIVVGGALKLDAIGRSSNGDPRGEAVIEWVSDNPAVATVDQAGVATGLKPGKATLRASVGKATSAVTVEVVTNPVNSLAISPNSTKARTGDVVRFKAEARGTSGAVVQNPSLRWTVGGEGAMIADDGAFVAERPGTYVVTAVSGQHASLASVVVTPRNAEREIEIVGRATLKDQQAAEQWIIGNYAYLTTISDTISVFDISDPANPKLTDSLNIDARLINDFSTTPDGRIGVFSREGSSTRINGITFVDLSDPAHPKLISDYTATVTGGVHSAFVDSHYVYLTDDATGSLRVIDFKDVKAPKEVARWEVQNGVATPALSPSSQNMSGRYLHDVQVVDGLAYLAYWRDGLVILDVGKGIKGGRPESPKLVSQLRFNYHELYGDGWTAGAHAVFRHKNYVFVGDEVFPIQMDIKSRDRFPVRGIVHVIDVSDLERPRKVAEYGIPEAGSHNIWVKDDLLYMGYYTGGGRVVDVSGELRGDLYRQGREIARVWTGDPAGFRPNVPLTWGAQPHKDLIFFNDINTGLWIVKLGKPKEKGSTTAPGY